MAEGATPALAWYRRLIAIPAPPASRPDPAADRAAALRKFETLAAADQAADIPEATRTRLFEPEAAAAATIIIWHGFTNAPSQFAAVAEHFQAAGLRVLVPRMPYQGLADVLNRELAQLTPAELVDQIDACVDIAAGFGDPVWVVGLSAGATMAGWAAATRGEVRRLVLAAPLVAPKGMPMPLLRLMVGRPRLVPHRYWWWDPRVKEKIVGSPYAYPGFPIPGIMPYLLLSESLFDHQITPNHRLERVVLTTNPGDFAIRRDAARDFAAGVFAPRADFYGEAHIDGALKWMHDFVDPWAPGAASTEQVVAILSAALGASDEVTAGGVLVPPLLTL